jgi:hypothetical protein
MKKILLLSITLLALTVACGNVSPEPTPAPVVEEIVYEQIVDNGKIYSSKDFFNAGFNEYKEYNVSKLTGATEAWYGYWGQDEDSDTYYELRFYPDHSIAVSEGTPFAEDATGEDAKLKRQDTMWRVGLTDRKRTSLGLDRMGTHTKVATMRIAKYGDYMIYNNVIMLCMGEDSNEAFQLCNDLIDILNK